MGPIWLYSPGGYGAPAPKLLSGSQLPRCSRLNDRARRMTEKKWESEADIQARIRELTGEIRQLRQELRQSPTPPELRKPVASDGPRRRHVRSKKR
jgi:hypothetical protein